MKSFIKSTGFALALLLTSSGIATAAASSTAAPQNAENISRLTEVLKSDADQKQKADACRELARIAGRDVVPILGGLLADEKLSHMARYALETIPDPEVDKLFRAAVTQLHGRPLVGVIGSIGVRRDAKAVKPLSNLLSDTDPDVAQAAARALGKIGDAAAAKALQKALPGASEANRLAFCEGLLKCAERLATDGHAKQATAIYDELRKVQAGHQVRTAALRGAILTRQTRGLPLLVESLRSPEFGIFDAAVRTSLELPGEPVTKALAAELGTASADKQIVLCQTLATRGDLTAVPALLTAAKNCAPPVRVAALRAAAQLGDPASIPAFVELMGADDAGVASAAQEALAGLQGKEADSAVLAMLRSNDPKRRATGLDLVGRRRMKSAVPELYKLTSSAEPDLRAASTRKIAELGSEQDVPAMLKLLSGAATPQDIEATEQALGTLTARAADRNASAQTLAAALPSANSAQKCALVRVLGTVGGPAALSSVRQTLTDSDPEVRATSIRSLGTWNGTEAAPDLLQLARTATDPKDRQLSVRSYIGLASQSDLPAEKRLEMCREATALVQAADEKKLLLGALGNIRSPQALSLIVPSLEDADVKNEAATACLSVASKLLEGNDAAANAPGVVEPLRKVQSSNPDSDLSKRAQTLLDKAQKSAPARN